MPQVAVYILHGNPKRPCYSQFVQVRSASGVERGKGIELPLFSRDSGNAATFDVGEVAHEQLVLGLGDDEATDGVRHRRQDRTKHHFQQIVLFGGGVLRIT
ncbi:hypothetical protein D3C76_1441210 [compost metagenome]